MPWGKKWRALNKRERTEEKDNSGERTVNKFWKMKNRQKNEN